MFLLREMLPSKQIESAGLGVESSGLKDADMDSQARQVAISHGHEWVAHRARQISSSMVKWADLILVMDDKQKVMLSNVHPQSSGKVMLLGHWLDQGLTKNIPDPYRKSDEAFEHVYQQIFQSVELWVKRIN